ncbi:MAG: iron-containing alcohol dehydrogenase, partial [Spirochaetota bacterium]
MEFSYYMPTRIVCGPDCIRENSDTLQGLGMNAFIMTGAGSAQKNGSLRDVVDALEHEGIEWKHYSKVSPNPTLEQVRDAAEQAYTWGADCVIAIGGGSPMDAAKAVAVLAGEPVPDDELLSAASFPKVLPLVAVPTTAGTGSEVTPYSILTNDSAQTKSLLRGDQIYPRIAFLDGRYTMELPRHITIATAVDAL